MTSAGLLNLGTAALEDGAGRVDFARLRSQRRTRLYVATEADDLDVLILGREANARYATGARRLFTSGTRPFGPGCVIVRATEQAYLLTTWDDGIPPEIPRENLHGITWNPTNLVTWLASMDGFSVARRIGVDAMSPMFIDLLPAAAPGAAMVDATVTLDRARRVKTPDEITCIRTAIAIAESSLAAAMAVVRPGVTERELLATFEERMASLSVTTPAAEGTFCGIDRRTGELRRLTGDRAVNSGDMVAMQSGVLYAGYEGTVGRTVVVGDNLGRAGANQPSTVQRELFRLWSGAMAPMVAACRPGGLLPVGAVRGVGLGYEPVHGPLEAGMVVALEAYVGAAEVGGCLGQEVVLVTDGEPERLTSLAHPLDVSF